MRRFLSLVLIALVVASCVDPESSGMPDYIRLSETGEYLVLSEGGNVFVEFRTNNKWNLSVEDCSWITPNIMSGPSGTSTVKLSVARNTDSDQRSAEMVISAGSVTETIRLRQLQENQIGVDCDSFSVDSDGGTVDFTVLSNIQFSVSTDSDWLSVVSTKALTSTEVTIAVSPNSGVRSRNGIVSIVGDDKKIAVEIWQDAGIPYFYISTTEKSVGIDGGEVVFSFDTNCDFTVVKYDYPGDLFPWAHVKSSASDLSFSVDANSSFDPRTAYATIVVPDILIPVQNSEGPSAGEMEPYAVDLYVSQDGRARIDWDVNVSGLIPYSGGRLSMAGVGDCLVVCNGTKVLTFLNRADGSFIRNVEAPFVIGGITNDSLGNIVFTVGGDYPLNDHGEFESDTQTPLSVYAIHADELMGQNPLENANLLITYVNKIFGYGLDNIRVTGDIFGNAVVSMCSAAAWSGGSHMLAWQVTGGIADCSNEGYTMSVELPIESAVWKSYRIATKALSNNISDGFFYLGEDTKKSLFYLEDVNASQWERVLTIGRSDTYGFSNVATVTHNGRNYLSAAGVSEDTTVACLIDVSNAHEPTLLSVMQPAGTMAVPNSNTDTLLFTEPGGIVSYVLDGYHGKCTRIIYPD